MIRPNTFIVGAQKAATTSLYNWISQHPEVCGPNSIKDYPFFLLKDINDKKEIEKMDKEYLDAGYNNHNIILHGNVQYMFEETAIKTIYNFDVNSKLICVLRNPIDRAISAYNYFQKLNLEKRPFKDAIENEQNSLLGTKNERHDFTYISHGLYFNQIKNILSKFKKSQLLVLFYEDIIESPQKVSEKTFKFLNIDSSFTPQFKHLNSTGSVRFKLLQKMLFNDNKLKKFLVENLIDPIIPIHKRTKYRLAIAEWNTQKNINSNKIQDNSEMKLLLKGYFEEDIQNLEKLLGITLNSWKN